MPDLLPMLRIFFVLTGFCAAAPVWAADSTALLHPMFQDHAVLQRGQPIRIYGRAPASAEISVSLADASARTSADASGRWMVTLPELPAGGPHTLTARSSTGASQTVNDVLVGDVFLCSGQSNMVLEVKRTLDSRAEIQNSANERIRMLTVQLDFNPTPLEEFRNPVQWHVAGPSTIAEWSATCFYFARELQKTVDVPMGLVTAAWGGSKIQPWMSAPAIQKMGGYAQYLELLNLYARDPAAVVPRWGEVWQNWWRSRASNGADPEPWKRANTPGWRPAAPQLGPWEKWGVPELASFNGMLWYRTHVQLTKAQAAQKATLVLGTIDEMDQTWVNGIPRGYTSGWDAQREYPLPVGALRAGDNVVLVNARDTYGSGGMNGPAANQALRLADGTSIPLTAWEYRIVPSSVGSPPRAPWEALGGLSTIHNAMIAPIGAYNFRAVLWYQGEANTEEAQQYEALLAGLMGDWRAKYGAALPFLIVQLANYGPASTAPVESDWARLREAQRLAVMHDDHAALAVAVDIGDRYDIHPANKQELAKRLARAARHKIYGEAIAPSGPTPVSAQQVGNEVVVSFKDVERELVAYSAEGPIGFELCGKEPGTCRFALARLDGTRVRLTASVEKPARVRFCWADSPVCTLFDRADLPAVPFELAIEPQVP